MSPACGVNASITLAPGLPAMACSPNTASSKSPAWCASLPETPSQSSRPGAIRAKAAIGSTICSAAGLASLPVMKSSSMSSTSRGAHISVLSSRVLRWHKPPPPVTHARRRPASNPGTSAGNPGTSPAARGMLATGLLLQCVLSGAPAVDGSAPGPGLLVCRVTHAGAQRGQDGIVVRGARHVGAQPAAAIGFQLRAGGGEQADSALRVVLLGGDGGEGFEVVGGAGFVPGFGREGQPFLQVSGGAGQVALRLAAERQVIERGEDRDPVVRTAGNGQGFGEQPRGSVVVGLAEADLAEEIIEEGDANKLLEALVPGEIVVPELLHQGPALVEAFAGAGVIAADCRDVAQHVQNDRVEYHPELLTRLLVQRQALLEERLRPVQVSVGDDGEAGCGQRQRPLIGRQA